MKTLISLIAVTVFSYGAIAVPANSTDSANEEAVSVLVTTSLHVQDEQPPAPAVEQAPPAVEQAVPEPPVAPQPTIIEPQAVVPPQVQMAPSVLVDEMSYAAPVASNCCPSCCVNPCCCCPPPPTPTTFCLVDPCGCTHEACIKVPACCAGQQPCVNWRDGIFGRQIATLCWDCCGHEVKVVVTRNGKVKVRG